jgi:hypothetical protein
VPEARGCIEAQLEFDAMPIAFACPSCKARYDVTDELAGKSILCRVCQKRGTVPAAPAKPAEPAKAAAPAQPAAPINPTRRRVLLMVAGGLGAIITGAVLARHPWKHWGDPPPASPDDPGRRRGPGGRGKGGGPGGDPKRPPGPPPDRAQKKARGVRGGAPRAGRAGA